MGVEKYKKPRSGHRGFLAFHHVGLLLAAAASSHSRICASRSGCYIESVPSSAILIAYGSERAKKILRSNVTPRESSRRVQMTPSDPLGRK